MTFIGLIYMSLLYFNPQPIVPKLPPKESIILPDFYPGSQVTNDCTTGLSRLTTFETAVNHAISEISESYDKNILPTRRYSVKKQGYQENKEFHMIKQQYQQNIELIQNHHGT